VVRRAGGQEVVHAPCCSDAVIQALDSLDVDYPKVEAAKRKQKKQTRAILEAEDG
jgi:hypothetical protein